MNIIVNARFLTQQITGVQRHALEMSRQLKILRPEIEFVAPDNIIHHHMAQLLQVKIVGRLRGHAWEQISLPRYVRKRPLTILLNLANTAPLFLKNEIVTIHDTGFIVQPQWYSRRFYYYYRFLLPRLTGSSLKIITDSQFAKNEIVERLNIDPDKIEVIPCGLPEIFINPQARTSENKYGQYILVVASLDPRKNLERVIQAFTSLNLKDTILVIAGVGHKTFASNRQFDRNRNLPNVIFTGYVTDQELIQLYLQARMMVFASLYEGFGLPPLEAMACGCPCLVSRAASIPEICAEAVLYCDPYDISDIADKIRKMLLDVELRNKLIDRGRKRSTNFSWKDSARQIIRIMDELEPS